MQPIFNKTLLMSGADYMSNAKAINAHMHTGEPFDVNKAIVQHNGIKKSLQSLGVRVISVPPPEGCQDGIFTSNWGLTRGNKVLLSNLPNVRKPEEPYARKVLEDLGFEVMAMPPDIKFSGQADALPFGNYVFAGSGYRSDKKAHKIVADTLGYQIIDVQAIPALDEDKKPVINAATGWPDSLFYDIDLAIGIIYPPTQQKKGLIAWCPEALVPESQELMRSLAFVDKIEVSYEEAVKASACNFVSTGSCVIMNANAPNLKQAIESYSVKVEELHNEELFKNGGSVRCSSLTLYND